MRNLSHHFAANTTCGTSDEDAASIQLAADSQHIYNNLVARKKVFDVHFMQLTVAKFALSVPFLCRGRQHHDFDICGNEVIDECFLFAEVSRLKRAYHKGADILLAHDAYDVLLFSINRKAHQPLSLQVVIGANEALDYVTVGSFVANALCEADSAVLCAIDEDAFSKAVNAEEVVHRLY